MELTTVLARVVRLYDMRLATPSSERAVSSSNADVQTSAEATLWRRDQETQDKFVSRVYGPWVQFRARRH